MSNYTKTVNFAAKDSLPSGNAAKIVKGTEIDTEFNNIATASATKADAAGAALTGTTTFETISDGTISITAFVDEDNMSSNSATLLPTQQSVKAYVDASVFSGVADGSISTAKLADDAVTAAKIADNAVGATQIADNAVDIARLNVSDGTSGQALTTDGNGTLSFANVSAESEFTLNTMTGDNSTTTLTMSVTPASENSIQVYFDGVYQHKDTFSFSGTTLTFSTAPATGVAVEVVIISSVAASTTPGDGTVTTAKLAGDAVTQAKIADDAVGADQLAASAVVTASIVDDAVTAAKIASEPVTVGITSVVTSASITATVNTHVYVDTAGRTITLPASPTIGQRVLITVGNFTDTVVGRNGSNIMSSGTDMTLDKEYLSIQFIYTNSTVGWAMA